MNYRGIIGNGRPTPASMNIWVLTVRFTMIVLGSVQILLILRVGLLLVGANQNNVVLAAVLDATNPFVDPFKGLLEYPALPTAGSVLDLAAIAAFICWTMVEALVLGYLAPRISARRIHWADEYDRRYGTVVAGDDAAGDTGETDGSPDSIVPPER